MYDARSPHAARLELAATGASAERRQPRRQDDRALRRSDPGAGRGQGTWCRQCLRCDGAWPLDRCRRTPLCSAATSATAASHVSATHHDSHASRAMPAWPGIISTSLALVGAVHPTAASSTCALPGRRRPEQLEALAVPVPPARPGPQARAPDRPRGLAGGDRDGVPGRLPARALPLRRLPGQQLGDADGGRARSPLRLPRWQFTNRSDDIRGLCCWALDLVDVAVATVRPVDDLRLPAGGGRPLDD